MVEQSYVERRPVLGLGTLVRVVWIQRVGPEPYVQRNLPTGGVELHCPVGMVPRLVGPLTRAAVEVLAPGTTVVGVRFHPGAAARVLGVPASEVVDLTVDLDEVWGPAAIALGELVAGAGSAEQALEFVQEWLLRQGNETDPLVAEAVRQLMPWQGREIGPVSVLLGISESQLRRRFLAGVGIGPKALQRTLRFQGFLALVQSGGGADGLAGLAADTGYADQAHLSRECLRLTGLPPSAFLGDVAGRCDCGHDHSASYLPMLRARFVQALDPASA